MIGIEMDCKINDFEIMLNQQKLHSKISVQKMHTIDAAKVLSSPTSTASKEINRFQQ